MQTRRDFLRNAAALTGSAFILGSIPEAVARAYGIDPEEGTTFLDAEHVVILMQENRSFDHSYGTLQGVRGYGDPQAHSQADGRPVWFQTDAEGRTYTPYRLDMKSTNVTWIGGLPHSWPDQVDARNGGKYDKWLIAKARQDHPLTMGYYTREDLPFYYAFADAFTVCDQAFCSSLTGTTPNRLYLWTGTIRKDKNDVARVQNGDTDYDAEAAWTTFPERLEDAGISWRVYQNEISLDSGFTGEEDAWLSNFTDNPLEWFTQYRVRFSKSRRAYIAKMVKNLPDQIAAKEKELGESQDKEKVQKELDRLKAYLKVGQEEQRKYTEEAWTALSKREKALHEKAFTDNSSHSDYRSLRTFEFEDGGVRRTSKAPKADTLHQFREDVNRGKLPAVSWIVSPEHFSDHPGSAWYGAWYVSEVLDILTKNPEVWKKTIFILCYDENDGYFDHVPPFVAPHPNRPETGKVSQGIDTTEDVSNAHQRDHSIGLGFRVPLVVASPWSRGGCVNSQVFDHTSIIQLIETWLEGKGKKVKESNISDWRRTVCGDMTSIFRPYAGETMKLPKPLNHDATIEEIDRARFRQPMKRPEPVAPGAIGQINVGAAQEPGTRPSCPLPYELAVNASCDNGKLTLKMEARSRRFGDRSAGSPFNVYLRGSEMSAKAYAVRAGDVVSDVFEVGDMYQVEVVGPNGFLREFTCGDPSGAGFHVVVDEQGNRLEARVRNLHSQVKQVELTDHYTGKVQTKQIGSMKTEKLSVDPKANQGWYHFTVHVDGLGYRYAGRVESGQWSITDPAIGPSRRNR